MATAWWATVALTLLVGVAHAQVCIVQDPGNGTTFDLTALQASTTTFRADATIDGAPVSFFVGVCAAVSVAGCPDNSGVCMTTTAGTFSVGAVRYQPDISDTQLTMLYPAGDRLCNVSGVLLPTSTQVEFVCNTDVITGKPEFVQFADCVYHLRWESSDACIQPDAIPLWARIILIFLLLILAALFSGLTLGLLSLDLIQLEILIASGTDKEKRYAKMIYPVRKHGNFLLCTLLLGNVMVNSSLSILMADLTSGIVGLITSTLAIVILGEILPQALCHKHGLAIGAHTIYIVMFFMLVTGVIAFPIGKFLDWMLGDELGTIFNKASLKELLAIHGKMGEITSAETKMLTGALDLTNKIVADVMTPLDNVFMLEVDTRLDVDALQSIMDCGHSRIPVYENDRKNIQGMVLVKDLAFLNPEDELPLRSVMEFYGRQLRRVYFDLRLDEMLQEFREARSHIALVWKAVESETGGDPVPDALGIITMEDVIEELLQMEILDETDESDPQAVAQADPSSRKKDHFSLLKYHKKSKQKAGPLNRTTLSEQQRIAVSSYLTSNLPEFAPTVISPKVMKRLLDVAKVEVFDQRAAMQAESANGSDDPAANGVNGLGSEQTAAQKARQSIPIYAAGQTCEFFTLVLQGSVEVRSGHDGFISEAGPFMHMGLKSLRTADYKFAVDKWLFDDTDGNARPDFTASVKEYCQLLRITRRSYEAAVHATSLEYAGSVGKDTPSDAALEEQKSEQSSLLGASAPATPTSPKRPTTPRSTKKKPKFARSRSSPATALEEGRAHTNGDLSDGDEELEVVELASLK